ncbi:hypothetical protein BT69DRAFT_1317044 [Atractiella rhizophila]|nr:hypothetical protein BT69DRAFT_1317044 [Atractiella rhizophila]
MTDQCAENVEVVQCNDALQSSVFSPRMKKRKTSISCKDDQGTESIALAHLITPVTIRHGSPIHLSILPSFLSRLPPSIHMIRVTFVLPLEFWRERYGPSKSSYFSVEGLENAVDCDDAMNLYIVLERGSITVTFGDTKHHASVEMEDLSWKPFTCTFHLPDNRSQVLFEPVALYSKEQQRFIPLSKWEESTIPSTGLATTIQLSFSTTRHTGISLCSIAHLPPEILSLIFEFLSFDQSDRVVEDIGYLVSFERLSAICQLWKVVSVPYLHENVSVKEKHACLTAYPNAGRLWTYLSFVSEDDDISGEMAKDVIAGALHVTDVYMDALWNEEEARIVLHVIERLRKLDTVWFGGEGSRKWKKDEVENFTRRMGDRIRFFCAFDVEDCASSTSPGLELSSDLKRLTLHKYPPLPSLALPLTLTYLGLSKLCPLPPSVSGSCLPPLLERLIITLAPYLPEGKISILPCPLGLSHLKHLTQLYLDGGEETSNLVSPQFFHTLTNAIAITTLDVWYCVVDWEFTGFVFSDFICWFFGDRGVKEEGDTVDGAEMVKTMSKRYLRVQLFFGGWLEDEIYKARSTLSEFVDEDDQFNKVTWVREGGEE